MELNTSILQYIDDVKSGKFTVEEFTTATLDRIKSVDENVHAYLSLNESAINDAKKIDQKITSGETVGKCFGFPISIKDSRAGTFQSIRPNNVISPRGSGADKSWIHP